MSQEDFEFTHSYTAFKSDYAHFELDVWRRPCDGATRLICHARLLARWSPSILRACQAEWRKFRAGCTQDIYATPQYDDVAKWVKFVSLFGFVPLSRVLCNDGAYRPIYISRTNYGQDYRDH